MGGNLKRTCNYSINWGPLCLSNYSQSSGGLKIFLCHSSGDKAAVRDLYVKLQQDGFNPWLDEEDLLPGESWESKIKKAIGEAHVALVCLTSASIEKAGFLQKEIKFVLEAAAEKPRGTIFTIPARLKECDMPEQFQEWHWVNLFEDGGYENLLRSLRQRVTELALPVSLTEMQPSVSTKVRQAESFPITPVPSSALSSEHATRIQRDVKSFRAYLVKAGFRIPPGGIQFEVVPGDSIDGYYSYYDWDERVIKVAGKYADYIDPFLHEYMRYALISDWEDTPDPFNHPKWWPYYSICSGLAVYYPCSYKGNPVYAKGSGGPEVILYNQTTFSGKPTNEVSADSIGVGAWGGAFWELRNWVGKPEVVDRLLASTWVSWHPFNPDEISASFVRKLIKIDQTEGGQNEYDIRAVFNRRQLNF
jgi:hypothetical protein